MNKNRKFIFYIIFGAVLLLAGCSTFLFKNYGNIRLDNDVTNTFEKFQISTNINYYISGSDVYPTSILGLNKAYILDTDLWKKIEMTPELFSELVTNMLRRSLESGQSMRGFYIFDNKNNKIGIWYSLLSGNIVIQMKEDSKVAIFPPRDDDSYRRYEGKSGGCNDPGNPVL